MERPRFRDRLRAALHVQFATNVQDVFLGRVHTEDQLMGDLAVGRALQNSQSSCAITLNLESQGKQLLPPAHSTRAAGRPGRSSRQSYRPGSALPLAS